MISTPICDFVRRYAASDAARLHMPGHKGRGSLGCEALDITEISGADDLYHPWGIIAESEENASRLFGWPTYYSTEGSSLCIRAMLFLALAGRKNRRVLAGRNAHKTFLNTAVLLDFEIHWLWPETQTCLESCRISAEAVERAILALPEPPAAVYLTSPDYLGNMADIAAVSVVCRRRGVLLLVDNAHGAYLKFLTPSRHPMDLGADLCCDSAHKTLPVLTGGAYLHVRQEFAPGVKDAMALFGSTSPSYLILQSLDGANPALERMRSDLSAFLPAVAELKQALENHGYTLTGDEPMKLTLQTRSFGYTGGELAAYLEERGLFCEFSDPDCLVLMLTPANTAGELARVGDTLCAVPQKPPLPRQALPPLRPPVRLTPRQAAFAPRETVPAERSLGRILAAAAVSCPPAIPIVMCGEEIDAAALAWLRYYGIDKIPVVSPLGMR